MSGFDYLMLTSILMSPDERMPQGMIDALFFTHEMGVDSMMDELLKVARSIGLEIPADSTAMDAAMRIWVTDSSALEKKHGERHILRSRTFEHYQSESMVVYSEPSADAVMRMEESMDEWFTEHKLGGNSKLFIYPGDSEVWFLIRRGATYKRESAVQGYKSKGIFFRPEAFDVACYIKSLGELRVHAKGKGMQDLYRRELGRLIAGNPYHFPGEDKYILSPLLEDGQRALCCKDIPGIDWIMLAGLRVKRQFIFGKFRIDYTSQNVFLIFTAGGESLKPSDVIEKARFTVKFSDSEKPRSVTIFPPNRVQVCRDSDAMFVETWLRKRGFIIGTEAEYEESESLLASL
ncbi:MAG: hypothetical protein M1305_08145 [Candidatus Marsarchaeota archaeon]|nr:hypothetical protein [Candidatus Marsarchaeota archaeon]